MHTHCTFLRPVHPPSVALSRSASCGHRTFPACRPRSTGQLETTTAEANKAAAAPQPSLSRRLLLSTTLLSSALLSAPYEVFAAGGKVFFELKQEGEPAGRIVIELFDDVKVGSARFRDLAIGKVSGERAKHAWLLGTRGRDERQGREAWGVIA